MEQQTAQKAECLCTTGFHNVPISTFFQFASEHWRRFLRRIAASPEHRTTRSVDGYAHLSALVRPSVLAGIAPDADDDVLTAIALSAKADFHAVDR